MITMFDGKKTYVVALLSSLSGLFIWGGGDPKFGALFIAVGAGLATLRDAIAKV